jgi:hypothetical protein
MKIFSPVLKGTTTSDGTSNLSGSFTGSLSGTAATASYVVSSVTDAAQNTRLQTLESVTGSYASTSSLATSNSRISVLENVTGSYASTGSNQFNGSQTITGSLTATGTITAQTLVVQTITSSVEFVTGSNRFGSTTGNTHEFTGSLLVSGSQIVNGNVGIGTTSPLTVTNFTTLTLNGTSASLVEMQSGGTSYARVQASPSEMSLLARGGTPMIFYTNPGTDTERMRITNSGSVGIGTTSPSYKLDVNGVVNSKGYVINGDYSSVSGVPNAGIYGTDSSFADGFNSLIVASRTDAARPIIFATYNGSSFAERMRITAAGNVGIGTTNPSGTYGKLSVAGGISILNDNNAKLEIGRYSSGTPNSYIKIGANSNSLRFTNNTDAADVLEITNSGSLGLGVTPSAWTTPFTVIQGGAYGQSIGFQSNGPDIKIGTNNYYYGGSYLYTTSNGAAQLNIGGNSGFQFNTAPSGTTDGIITFTQVVTITQGGVVGIGITNPSSAYLDITGTNDFKNSLQLRSGNIDTGTSSNQILFGFNGTETYRHAIKTRHMSAATAGNAIDFYVWKQGTDANGTIGTQHVMSLNGGNVGIGTTSPTLALSVIGQVRAGYATNAGVTIGLAPSGVPNNDLSAYILWGDNATFGGENGDLIYIPRTSTTGAHRFYTGAFGLASEKMRITSGGNVGIGTSSPGVKFEVIGTKQTISSTDNGVVNITDNSGFAANSGGSLVFRGVYNSAGSTAGTGFIDTLKDNGTDGNYSYAMAFGSRSNGSSSIERMRITSAGYLTLPYQPAFYAWYNGGNSTRTTGAFTSFNSVRVNRGGHYNTSNGRFTAPIAGVYEFTFSLLFRQSNETGAGEISIGVNGSNLGPRGIAYSSFADSSNGHAQTLVKVILSLSANDYVTGWIHASGNTDANWYFGENLGYFCGTLIG